MLSPTVAEQIQTCFILALLRKRVCPSCSGTPLKFQARCIWSLQDIKQIYLTGSGCGCKKFSLVSVIVIHNVIHIIWCNYCRINKGTSTKGIIFVIYLDLCHILLKYFLSVQESSQPEEDFSFLPILKPCFSFIIPTLFWVLCEGRTEPGLILSLIRVLKGSSCGLQQAVYYEGMSFYL